MNDSGSPDTPEFARPVRVRPLPATVSLRAEAAECAALAVRFGVAEIRSFVAEVELEARPASIIATGVLQAKLVQDCALSGEPFSHTIEEPIALRFVEASDSPDPVGTEDDPLEVAFAPDDADEIAYTGDSFDLGEAVAQTLGLAIDPYAEGPEADMVRREHDLAEPVPDNPFAALKELGSKRLD